MNWEATGAIADIVGATAVLATLIYLALQIRQNSRSINQQNDMAKAQTIQARADSVTQLMLTVKRWSLYLPRSWQTNRECRLTWILSNEPERSYF